MKASPTSDTSQVGVVVALPEEAKALNVSGSIPSIHRLHPSVTVYMSGAGGEAAVRGISALVAAGCQKIVSFGTAAALSPNLQAGDWVLPEKIVTNEQTFLVDTHWHQAIAQRVRRKPLIGDSYGLDQVVGPKEKQAIFKQTNCLLGDMESGAMAQECQRLGLPFCAIRVVVDDAVTAIPSVVTRALGPSGVVSIGRLILGLITHPWQLPSLLRLARQFSQAKQTMALVADDLAPDFAAQGPAS